MTLRWSRLRSASGAVALGALLVILAVLQYRWVGELSAAELVRLRASAERRAAEFARAFDREITRGFLSLSLRGADAREDDWGGLWMRSGVGRRGLPTRGC